ncbi:hypothetical protein Aspvir_009172 [Aspergillus viridinutans]|uniref:VCBS repeat-containing protein n=1 Tax=Aspergillus viridinutans TaxID=75553 RepID=A0A9P3C2L1_ASPVI|nr:uncharacterized protein Aspvir_009172 [Aspergillus viridinutans]GIK05073.1 hypothetical protein Aspvir_009172 [Aspergillus viridinutans]
MDPPALNEGSGWLDLNKDYYDNIHPNDIGYPKMAVVWYQAISTAFMDTLLKKPGGSYVVTPGSDGLQCDKQYGDGVYAGGLTQRGSGEDDGIYRHDSASMGIVLTVESDYDRNQWFFVRLFARERDDFVGWYERNDGSQWYGVWRNTGDEANLFTKIADMNVSIACIPRGVNFIDINADGLDDFVCIGPGGDAYPSINQGDGDIGSGKPPSFKDIGQIKDAVSGYPQAQVRLGDVDGDGRADYCVFDAAGDMTCWRNGWIEDKPAYWQGLGQRFSGKNMGNLTSVRLEDIHSDGRDDWVWIGDTGEAYMSCQHGTDGDGLNIAWRQGFWQGTNSGPTYNGMSVDGVRERIHFARVYGEPEDFGLLGRQDYVYLEHSKDGDRHKFAIVVDGGPSFWDSSEVIFDLSTFGRMLDRWDLHLADWDGDGACDIIWVDPDNQNRVQLWRNTYKETGTWNWDNNANPAPDLYCPEKRGIGIFDLPVQFADISGNGKADYLCIEKDGRTWGWVHNDANGWDYIDQFKYSEQKDHANLRWADVNGD